jgi:hypothetical protein
MVFLLQKTGIDLIVITPSRQLNKPMHNLLGYRFDNLMQERISNGADKQLPCRALSFRIPVSELGKEKDFFVQLLGISPLVENDGLVIIPISNGVTLNLMAVDPNQPADPAAKAPALELDVRVTGFQKAWQTASRLYHCREDALSVAGSRRSFKVTSPSGIVLRLWQ